MSKNVYVVGRDGSVEDLFLENGFEVFVGGLPGENILKSLALVVFTGGSDIDPAYYGEEIHGSYISEYSRRRDAFEVGVYEAVRSIPKAGICRGGQLFNIMNGGRLVQHIDGHGGGNHPIYFRDAGGKFTQQRGMVNSCHHQMMVPSETIGHEIIACAAEGVPEIIYYPKYRDLCFQAHPEWGHKNTTDLFMGLVREKLL